MNTAALILNVFGGLAIFIFGMKMMSDGLHKIAGEKMRSVLRLFSSNRFVAILSGAAVTSVIQSSSASTVMVIGFVNAGLLSLVQAVGIIFGANIGTTITAQIVAFEISWIIMPSIISGLVLTFVPRQSVAGWGETIMGLGFLFFGMQIMSGELSALAEHPMFVSAFHAFDCAPVDGTIPPLPLFGAIATGLVMTMVIQSSSAATGIVIALGASGLLDLYTATALILGSNIGTTITAQLAAIPANRIAKQAALAHTLFNVVGVTVIVFSFVFTFDGVPVFFAFVDWMSADGDLPRKIANAHTLFNVITAAILVPFIPLMARCCERLIPLKSAKIKYKRLEPHLIDTPTIALAQTSAALRKMLKKAWKMVDCSFEMYNKNVDIDKAISEQMKEREKRISERQNNISGYLARVMTRPLSPEQAEQIPVLLHCTNDAQRIGDHTDAVLEIMRRLKASNLGFRVEEESEFFEMRGVLSKQAETCISLLEERRRDKFEAAEELKNKLAGLANKYENAHIERMKKNPANGEAGILYLELISEIRKVSGHLANIADKAGKFYGEIGKRITGAKA